MADEGVTKHNRKLTAVAATQSAYVGDAAGRLDLAIQVGDSMMELTRLSGGEGRKGTR